MTEAFIRDLEAQLRAAQIEGDVATLHRLIADDLLFAGPDGALVTKAHDLAAYRDKVLCITAHQVQELQIRAVRNDVFLVSMRARLAGTYRATAFASVGRYTRVWAKDSDAWRIVGGQVAMFPDDAT